MTSKERGQYIHDMLKGLTKREENVLREYFGINTERRSTLEEIGRDFEITTRKVNHIKNRGVRKIRYRLINDGGVKGQSDLKEYVEGINPDLIHKELPYHYSKSLDEFMLCLIDGVENTTSRSSKEYKIRMILREIHEMSLEERRKISKDNGKEYREKRLKEMGDGMYKWDYLKGLIEKI